MSPTGSEMTAVQVLAGFLESLTGVASVFIAFFLFRLGKKQRSDSWFRSFNEIHHAFWVDEDFESVRGMIANDERYRELDSVLEKRFKGRDHVSAEEYRTLEAVDKFFNFLLRAREVADELGGHRDLWERIYFQYWVNAIIEIGRHRLWMYFMKYYEENAAYLPVTVGEEVMEAFRRQCTALDKPTDA